MADLEAKLVRAAEAGLHKLTIYRSNTGAWHATAIGTLSPGSSAVRTPDGAACRALDEYLSRTTEEDPFA